jgi:hypothetical protein
MHLVAVATQEKSDIVPDYQFTANLTCFIAPNKSNLQQIVQANHT